MTKCYDESPFVYIVITDTGGIYVFADATDAQEFTDAHGVAEGPYEEPVLNDPAGVAELIAAAREV